MKKLHIFKGGTHTDSGGKTVDFSDDMMNDTVAVYDPDLHQAPLVIGHPNTNDPAMGWVTALDYTESNLHAETEQVNADFEELVKSGAYKKISASFYLPDAPNNPVPGSMYLRHVGFLGGKAPAIKGLSQIEFNDAEEGVVCFEDSFETGASIGMVASLFKNIKKYLISKSSVKEADDLIPDHVITELERSSERQMNPKPNPLQYEESDMDLEAAKARITELEGQLDTANTENTALKGKVTSFEEAEATAKKQKLKDDINADVEALVKNGHIKPAEKGRIASFCELLETTDQTVSFGEGDDKVDVKGRGSLIEYLKTQKAVDFNEHSKDESGEKKPETSASLAQKAVAYQEEQRKAGNVIDIVAAVNHVSEKAE